ncbi:MAG: hypothetical protein JWO62_2922, partial [Acidimicrobiaceae bacterium]|nr:hypothetical protein [Acidimicrobiaceae bacterium]
MWPVSGRGARDARAAGASGTATAGD